MAYKKILSEGRLSKRLFPVAMTFRIPNTTRLWLDNAVGGNKSYLVAAILEAGINDVKRWQKEDDKNVDIEDWIKMKRMEEK